MAVLGVEDHGAGRNGNQQILGRPAVAADAAAGLAVLGLPLAAMGQGCKAIDPLFGDKDHAAAVAAVAAVGPAAGDVFLPAKADAAVTPFARLHSNFRFIDKHDSLGVNPLQFTRERNRGKRGKRQRAIGRHGRRGSCL